MAARVKQSARRHQDLGLSDQDLLDMFRAMLEARLCDEAQFRLNRQGKAPFVVPVSGHEGCQVGTAWPFERGRDVFVPYYRDLAVCLVAGLRPRHIFLGVFGKRDDPSSGGRHGSTQVRMLDSATNKCGPPSFIAPRISAKHASSG